MSRRRVFQVLALYVALGWGFTEIVAGVVEQLGAPPAIATVTTIAFIIGFPIVLVLAWVFDVGTDGVQRVPTRGRGQLIISLALAIVFAGTYALYRYLPRDRPAAVAHPDDVMLAVVPFRDLSPDPQFAFLGQALAEDLLSGVAAIPGLRVKASFSSFALKDSEPAVFAQRLGVNRILDGTFRVQDANLRVNARLIDAITGDVVWTRVLTDSLSNVYQIQDQFARDIASEFGLVHPSSRRSYSRRVDPQVYELYLQARQNMINPWTDTESTARKIRQILDLEPNFPEALAMMGLLDTGRAWIMEDRQSPWLKTGEEYTLRALEIDPDLAEAYAVLALNYALQYRWSESRATADRAIEVAGSRPLNVIYTLPYNNLGHRDQTREILETLFDRDPLNPAVTKALMTLYVEAGEDRRALQLEQILRDRGERYQRGVLALAYARRGDQATALELAALWAADQGMAGDLAGPILTAWTTGRSPELEAATDRALAAGKLRPGQAIWDYMASGAPPDKVYALVRQSIPAGRFNQISLLHWSAAPYRQDPGFLQIYGELGMVDYWRNVELPWFCRSESIAGLCE